MLEPKVCRFLWDGYDGGAFETLGDFTQLQWSVEDLCEDGGQQLKLLFYILLFY